MRDQQAFISLRTIIVTFLMLVYFFGISSFLPIFLAIVDEAAIVDLLIFARYNVLSVEFWRRCAAEWQTSI